MQTTTKYARSQLNRITCNQMINDCLRLLLHPCAFAPTDGGELIVNREYALRVLFPTYTAHFSYISIYSSFSIICNSFPYARRNSIIYSRLLNLIRDSIFSFQFFTLSIQTRFFAGFFALSLYHYLYYSILLKSCQVFKNN